MKRAGRALWHELRDLDLAPGERVICEQACRTADDLERLGVALAAAPLTRGAAVSPLVAEVRAHRRLLVDMLAHLDVDRVAGGPAT